MVAVIETLVPAEVVARDNPLRIPGESAEYRAARTALLAEEIELRRSSGWSPGSAKVAGVTCGW